MTTQPQFRTATPAEAREIIQTARRMRSEYLGASIKAGWSYLRRLFGHKMPVRNAAA